MLELCDYKVPEGLEKNKMSVYITTSSPLRTYKAYLNQFQRDFTTFLKLRYEEMVPNGIMVLTFIGRNTIGNPLHRDCCHFWTLLSKSLRGLVVEVYIQVKAKTFISPLNMFKHGFAYLFLGPCECIEGGFFLHAIL